MFTRLIVLLATLLFSFPAAAQEAPAKEAPLKIVASFSILGDIAEAVGGEAVEVQTLVGRNEDAHSYSPSPMDAKKLAEADIILINGLHFEGWLSRLIKASGTKARLLIASAGVHPRILMGGGPHHHHGHHHEAHKENEHHDHEVHHETEKHHEEEPVVDPHAWQDLKNGQLYAKNIAGAIIQARPAQKKEITARAKAYIAKLAALDSKIREQFKALPKNRRTLITSHDAFGYFGHAYGLELLSPMGLSTESEPSAEEISILINQIKEKGVSALFVENITSPRLLQQLAKDTGIKIGGKLYTGALDKKGTEGATYLGMMESNRRTILEALK